MDLHVGKTVLDKVKEKGMKKSEFARRINKSRQNVQDIFKRQSLDTHLLLDICKVLEFNFFELLSDQLHFGPGHFMEDQASYRPAKTSKSQVQNLTRQLKLAQKEINYLKKINSLLDKKKGRVSAKKKVARKK